MATKKKQCDHESCDPYFDDINWICGFCEKLIDPGESLYDIPPDSGKT
jgi:hypothetical protein